MAIRAQLSQERSRLRRDELLAAAIELFAEGGSRAITHRAVAARAGLPSATTTYYFESIDDLIREALGAHIEKWIRDLEALTTIDTGAAVSLDDAPAFISHLLAVRRPEIAALELAIFLSAARVPELRDDTARAMQVIEDLSTKLLTRVGVPEPEALAGSIVALMLGTALRRQSGLHADDVEARQLVSAIRSLVAAQALGPDAVGRAIADLPREQQ
jgi:AcrR family transcriptional regulator